MRLFLSLLIFLPSLALAQTKPASDEQQRLADLQQMNSEAAALPQVKADSVRQLINFSVEQNMLAARTSLTSIDGQAHILIPDLRGVVRLTLFARQDPTSVGRNFQLLQQDLTDASAGEVYTMASAVAGRMILSRDSESAHTMVSVQLVEDSPPIPGGDLTQQPVRLLVRRNDSDDKTKELNLTLAAENFWDLRLRHGREVDLYLRPIIRDFQQESDVFAIPPPIAWQVLGSNYTPDAAMVQRVDTIVAKLDADDFRQRENAMKQLQNIGQPAALVLEKLDRQKLSPQQSAAVNSFLADFARLPQQQATGLVDDKSFLLDTLYDDDAPLRQLALNRLSQIEGRKIELNDASDIAKLREELLPTTQP